MQTFKLQVEDIIGRTISDTDGLNDMLNATAREVSDVLPKDVLLDNLIDDHFIDSHMSKTQADVAVTSFNKQILMGDFY